MKSGVNEALFALVMLAVWVVVLTAIYKRQRERIDKIPVVGPVCSAIAGIFPKREVQQQPPQGYAYPPQPYSVPVPNAQHPVYDYPPVPPQMAEQPAYSVPVQPTTEQPTQVVQPRTAPVQPLEDDLDDLFDKKLDGEV